MSMTDSDLEVMVDVQGNELSLAQIANINVDEIKEERGLTFPVSVAQWKVEACGFGTGGAGEKKSAHVAFLFVCTDVKSCADPHIDKTSLPGRKIMERVLLTGEGIDIQQKLGYVKGFMADTGFRGGGSFGELFAAYVGHEFIGASKQRVDRNDPDVKYAGFGIFNGFWKVGPVDVSSPAAESRRTLASA